jgi:CHAT domain-containing protein/tetratricopeptide (TPR) repeat protein
MNYRITAPGFLLAVLLTGGVVSASAQDEVGQVFANQPEPSAIAPPQTLAAGSAEAALVEGQQAYHQGQLQVALERLNGAIAQFEAVGNADGVAAAQVAIAPVYITMENRDEAATAIQAALSYYQAEGNVAGEAQALVNLGALQNSEKDYPAALATLQRAAELSEQAQDSFTQGIASLYVGVIYRTQEDYANALPYIDQALPLLQDDSDALRQGYYQASALMFKAICLMGLEEFDQARVLVEPIQAINQSLQHPALDGYLPFIQGTLAALQGDIDGALSSYQQSVALIQKWGFDREREGAIHTLIGGIYFEQKDFEKASQSFGRALAILIEQDNVVGQLELLFQIGNLYQENEYHAQAQTYYEAALPFARSTGRAAEGNVLNRIGLMLYFQEQYEQALEFFLPALEAMQDVGDHADEPTVLGNIANTYQQLGESEKAEEYRLQITAWHQQNVTNAENSGDYESVFTALNQLANLSYNQYQRFRDTGNEYLKSDPQAALDSAVSAIEAGETALSYAQKMLQIAQTHDREEWLAEANQNITFSLIFIGHAYQLKANAFTALDQLSESLNSSELALKFLEESIPFALDSGNESIQSTAYYALVGGYNGVNTAANSAGSYARAIEAGLQARELSQKINNIEEEIFSLSGLSNPHIRLASQHRENGDFDAALEVLAQAESFNREIIAISDSSDAVDIDKSRQERALEQLWMIAVQRQGIYKDQNRHGEALAAAYESLEIARQLDRDSRVRTSLSTIASSYLAADRYSEALLTSETLREFAEKINDFSTQASALFSMSAVHSLKSQYTEAIEKLTEMLTIAQEHGIVQYQVDALNSLGGIYSVRGDYERAVEQLNTALVLTQENRTQLEGPLTPELLNEICYLGFPDLFSGNEEEEESNFLRNNLAVINYQQNLDRQRLENVRAGCIQSSWDTEASILYTMGSIYSRQGRYPEAIDAYKESIAIKRKIGAGEVSEARTIDSIGDIYRLQGDYANALALYEQTLDVYVRNHDRNGQATTLNGIAIVYDNRGQHTEALNYYQQALTLAEQLGRQSLQNSIQFNLGGFPGLTGNFQSVLDTYYDVLEVERRLGRRAQEATTLNAIGNTYLSQAQLERAEQAYTEALTIARDIGVRGSEILSLGGLGDVADFKGDYATALTYYHQALEIAEEIDSQAQASAALSDLGFIYFRLGQYDAALDYYQRSFAIDVANGSVSGQATTLMSMGGVYYRQQQYDQALDYNQQALAIHQETGNLIGQVRALDNLGVVYERQGNYEQALTAYQAALDLVSTMDTPFLQANVLGGLGLTRAGLGDPEQAIDYLEQALAIYRDIGAPAGEALVLADMGKVLAQSGQAETATTFYKQAINIREGIREGIRSLDQSLQQSYVESVAETYRTLADLLLNQGRIPEAQQVLDLLQIEEVREFTHTRALWTGSTLAYTDPEQAVIDAHGSLIALGSKILDCEATNCGDLDTLYDQQEALKAQYDRQVAEFNRIIRTNRAEDDVFQNPETISGEAEKLLAAYAEVGETAVLIYPFVLQDKLWLVWATAGNVIGSVEVPVPQAELAATVQRFGALLNGGSLAELQATSQQLYGWIVEPLEAELEKSKVDHLVFVNDRVTRYIPMAALFDGERFLLERYRISTVLSPAMTETEGRLGQVDDSQVLGLGVTQAVAGFSPLPAVAEELTGIVRDETLGAEGIFPGRVFLDEAFTFDALRDNVTNHRVLHIATHAAFVPGRAQESFIVLGNGDRLSIPDIETIERRLRNLHLVVLSACQTALGGPAGDGTEIAGLSSYFLRTGRAETVVASLWKVNDDSTSLLMQRFYELLATGELTKAEALRQAQLSLLYNEDTATRLAATRADLTYVTSGDRATSTVSAQHPYHWAPFILIGNGL